MSPQIEIVTAVMEKYKLLWEAMYHNYWTPSSMNITETLDILKPVLPGFDPYSKEDLLRALDGFFRCKEDWMLSCKHSYTTFIKHIPRWLPAKTPQLVVPPKPQEGVYNCQDCGNELQLSELCLKCFPLCSNCGFQHAASETCEEVAKREERLKRMFGFPEKRGQSAKPSKDMKDVEKRFTTQPSPNHHPTVKPLALMNYLVKLITPKGGTVLDPFMGSGSTGVACRNLGMNFIGIEKEQEYLDIARKRIFSDMFAVTT